MSVDEFIERWKDSGGAERANYQMFLSELSELIGCEKPKAAGPSDIENAYVFDRSVKDPVSNTTNYIDLYKRGCFVLEAKQGIDNKPKPRDARQHELISGESLPVQTKAGTAKRGTQAWVREMEKARRQAIRYARNLEATPGEGAPPFLIVADVGYVLELYSDFSGVGANYTQFTDGMHYRVEIEDLRKEEVREKLRLVWTNPEALDPAKRSARVTRKIADQLAALGKSFEAQGHDSQKVARFLMRCLFSMFAEDVELIPKDSFTELLVSLRGNIAHIQPTLEALWATMDKGGFSPVLRHDLLKFNGGLFAECEALPINEIQLGLLIAAAEADWRDVEPAIFGTLLERALSPKERHKLGAHYTPRAYVERLVTPTIVEPLRADWDAVKAAAFLQADKGDEKAARDTVRAFHRKLCETRVLDPACGSGNFLYVAMEQMKRLEGEVLGTLTEFGEKQDRLGLTGETVDPHQFLGIELNPWAAYVAELVLWIGYLQWHFKTFGKATPSQPVLKDFHNIENRDALLVLEGQRPRMDDNGKPVTRWDGETTRRHLVTGEDVPDPEARVTVYDYESAKAASWPQAEFIVGNPPFIGASRMRDALGDGYVETLWKTYPKMPQSADFVMFWWEKAALLTRAGKARRFGFITTNSLRQTFNRRVLEPHLDDKKKPVSLLYAIPDHPWVDSGDGAAVRIAMTVAGPGRREGRLLTLAREEKQDREAEGRLVEFSERRGKVFANLQTGADVQSCHHLQANQGLAIKGMQLNGQGFILSRAERDAYRAEYGDELDSVVRPYRNGADLSKTHQDRFAIDLYPLGESEVANRYAKILQHLHENVKPERDQNPITFRRLNWWWFGATHKSYRSATRDLNRFIATTRTAKHRIFSFLPQQFIAESKIVLVALQGGHELSILSGRAHTMWSLATGG
tara:strand:+ start:6097 stop:8853 length:2757 start_codon:yes stop_codon:yes gene_type:complete